MSKQLILITAPFNCGYCKKAQEELGCEHQYTFETMLDEMIEESLKKYKK